MAQLVITSLPVHQLNGETITGQHPKYDLARADALLTGHVHGYYPNHPDPNVATAEMIIGSGGGTPPGVDYRKVFGFVEMNISKGKVSTVFIGDKDNQEMVGLYRSNGYI